MYFFSALQEKVKAGSSCTYEARGPGGSMLLIEVLTDNNTRTHQHIKHLVQKHGSAASVHQNGVFKNIIPTVKRAGASYTNRRRITLNYSRPCCQTLLHFMFNEHDN